MWIWAWIAQVYENERSAFAVVSIAAAVMLVSAIVSFFTRGTGVYIALSALDCSGAGIALAFLSVGEEAGFVSLALSTGFCGAVYLILFATLSVKKKIEERKLRRAEIRRRLFYTLPDRENSYIRTRLNTALRVEEEPVNEYTGALKEEKEPMKLEYARRLLGRVKAAPLSTAERLQTEEMGKAFSLYLQKDGWTAEELRAVNELCACLLKLSAKYAV